MSEMVTAFNAAALIAALEEMARKSTDFYERLLEAGFREVVEGYTSNLRGCAWFGRLAELCARRAGYTGEGREHTTVPISNEREAKLTNDAAYPVAKTAVSKLLSDLAENDNIHTNLQGSSQWVPNDGVNIPKEITKTVSLKPFFSMKQGDYERFIALVMAYHTTRSAEAAEALSSFNNFDGLANNFDGLAFYNNVTRCVIAHNEQMTKPGRKFLVLCNAAGKGLNPSVGACLGPIQVSDITPKGWGAAAFHFLVCTVAEPMGISVVNLARGEGEELYPLPTMPPQAPQFIAEYPDADAFVDRGGGRLALVHKDGSAGFRSDSYMEASGVIEAMMKVNPDETNRVCDEFVARMAAEPEPEAEA